MKKDIHPAYNDKVKVRCSCGAEFEVGSTTDQIKVEICSACHPLYTGNKRYVDTAGRMDKFQERLNKTKKMQDDLAKSRAKKTSTKAESEEETPASEENKTEKGK
jgi:large subunit ribosomal protein L31